MRLSLALLTCLMLVAGCAELSSRPDSLYASNAIEPALMLDRFRSTAPESFSSLNSVVFDYAGQKFLGLGFIEINRPERSFRVVCLNPMGVKLFDLAGDERGTTTNFALEPLARYGDIAAAVAADIRRIYFDTVPKENATPRNFGNRIIYGGGTPTGYQEHVYAGAAGDLVEKRYYDDQLISWRVNYFDYQEKNGRRYPRSIIITDYKNGYQLTVREKEQSLEQD